VVLRESGWGEAAVRGGTLGDLRIRWSGNGTCSRDELVKAVRAEALGGSLSHVEQLADVGLLGASPELRPVRAAAAMHAMAGGDGGDVPSLDPVPQTLTAIIDARFIADAMSIDDS